MNYYLIADSNLTQTLSFIIKDDSGTIEKIAIPSELDGEFLAGLMTRIRSLVAKQTGFDNQQIGDSSYFGWTISANDYAKVKRIIELYPYVVEFRTLIK